MQSQIKGLPTCLVFHFLGNVSIAHHCCYVLFLLTLLLDFHGSGLAVILFRFFEIDFMTVFASRPMIIEDWRLHLLHPPKITPCSRAYSEPISHAQSKISQLLIFLYCKFELFTRYFYGFHDHFACEYISKQQMKPYNYCIKLKVLLYIGPVRNCSPESVYQAI